MTQEDKESLLKDLCGRLPYGVKCDISNHEDSYYDSHEHIEIHLKEEKPIKISGIDFDKDCIYLADPQIGYVCGFENYGGLKPYLRPLSSMTEEEKEEYINIKQGECNGCVLIGKGDPNTEFLLVDFFNAHHFDYRKDDEGKTMIKKGLALKAPEGMYNN